MIIKCSIPNTDDPIRQIVPCLKLIQKIEMGISHNPVLNMSNLHWISPFSSLILSSKIDEFSSKGTIKIIPPKNKAVKLFLELIGFPLGKSGKSKTSFPIKHFIDNPEEKCAELIDFITERFPKSLRGNCLNFFLSELVDNIKEHSKYTHGSLMAQFFPNKNIIDIGVIDNGISIPVVFMRNGIMFDNDCAAILSALKGKSTKNEMNRGFGLPTTDRITTEALKGTVYIISNKGIIYSDFVTGRKAFILKELKYKGTIIYLRFNVPGDMINIYPYI